MNFINLIAVIIIVSCLISVVAATIAIKQSLTVTHVEISQECNNDELNIGLGVFSVLDEYHIEYWPTHTIVTNAHKDQVSLKDNTTTTQTTSINNELSGLNSSQFVFCLDEYPQAA